MPVIGSSLRVSARKTCGRKGECTCTWMNDFYFRCVGVSCMMINFSVYEYEKRCVYNTLTWERFETRHDNKKETRLLDRFLNFLFNVDVNFTCLKYLSDLSMSASKTSPWLVPTKNSCRCRMKKDYWCIKNINKRRQVLLCNQSICTASFKWSSALS